MRLKLTMRVWLCLILLLVCLPGSGVAAQDEEWLPLGMMGIGKALTVAWHPSGEHFLVMSENDIRFFDLNMQLESSQQVGGFTAVAWHPSGDLLALAEADAINFWDTSDLGFITFIKRIERAGAPIAWSPDGTRLAYAINDVIRIWELATERTTAVFEGHVPPATNGGAYHGIRQIVWRADGSTILSVSQQKLALWDATTGEMIADMEGAFTQMQTLVLPGGHSVVDVFNNKSYAVGDDTILAMPYVDTPYVDVLQASPDGQWLAALDSYQAVDLYQITDTGFSEVQHAYIFAELDSFPYETGRFLAWRADGEYLLAGTQTTVTLWRMENETLQQVGRLTDYNGTLATLAFSPDGSQLAAGYGIRTEIYMDVDSRLRLWDVENQLLLWRSEFPTIGTLSVAWHSSGRYLATGQYTDSCGAYIWDMQSHDMVDCLYVDAQAIHSQVGWQPNADRLAVAWDLFYLFDGFTFPVEYGESAPPYEIGSAGAAAQMSAFDWSPDGTAIVSNGYPGRATDVLVWRVADGEVLTVLEDADVFARDQQGNVTQGLHVKYSPDGKWIAVAEGIVYQSVRADNNTTIAIYDAATGKRAQTLRGHQLGVMALAWSPDSSQLLSASLDGTARLWTIAQPENPLVLLDIDIPLVAAAWSPVGHMIAVGTEQGVIYLMD
jgi:WD40 repeat protein